HARRDARGNYPGWMTARARLQRRILAIYPTRIGFAYAAVELPLRLIDWGQVKLGKITRREFRRRVERTLRTLQPTVVVCEDCTDTQRGKRTRAWIRVAIETSDLRGMATCLLKRSDVRRALGVHSTASRYFIIATIANRFEELRHLQPVKRSWEV